jgi:hypothetical protein
MHVTFKIHYRNNLIDKKDSYPIPRPPSWDDHNYSYGHQLYPSDNEKEIDDFKCCIRSRLPDQLVMSTYYSVSIGLV